MASSSPTTASEILVERFGWFLAVAFSLTLEQAQVHAERLIQNVGLDSLTDALTVYADADNWSARSEAACGCTWFEFQHPTTDGASDGGALARKTLASLEGKA